jgi:TRAP-type C4-dicarboxylate transport system substrate-binding protein
VSGHPRSRSIAAVLAALLAIVGAAGLGGAASAKELKLATYLPPTHRIVALYEELGRDLAKETGGDLTLKVYAGGTLGAGPFQQYKRAVEGVADIADICHAFHAKVFAKTMLVVLPGAATSAVDATTSRSLQPIRKELMIRFHRYYWRGGNHGWEGDFGKAVCRAVER